ncbi:MAG: SLBB domain-containing protein [Chitinispirillaceae bacterium]|nr:SLBB domain-containing protein [Chitinispirillaceae bacterium]
MPSVHDRYRILSVVILFFFVVDLPAQTSPFPSTLFSSSKFEDLRGDGADLTSISGLSEKGALKGRFSEALDNSIDETHYMVGGGDVFIISSTDKTNRIFLGTVSQNGDMLIPDLGEVAIGKVSLKKAKELIKEFVRRKIRGAGEVVVALHKAKIANVNVIGMVVTPGTYEIAGVMRIWDAIGGACRNFDGVTVKRLFDECDMRSINRIHGDSLYLLDMFTYVYQGDFTHNPYVYPGDKIIINPLQNRIFIHGEIAGPRTGWIPLRQGERAVDFLALFMLNENSDSGNIQLRRKQIAENGSVKTQVIRLAEQPGELLCNGDVITVPSKKNAFEVFMMTIDGEVRRPGMYPIEKSGTSPEDVFAMAGGKTPFANEEKTVVIRRNKFSVAMPMIIEGKTTEFGEPISSIRPELGSAMGLMTSTKDYSILKLKDNPDLKLEPNDQIFVPRSEKTVYVSGNVRNPGGYPYVKGKTKEYYIQQAGGFTEKASRPNVYLVAEYGDVRQVFNREIIEDGDVIVVPMSQEFKKLTTIILPILNAGLGMLGLLVGLYATLQ